VLASRTRRIGLGAAVVVTVATAVAIPATRGHAAPKTPSLRMLTAARQIVAERFDTESDLYIPQSVYLEAVNGAFEIDATRVKGKVHLEQVMRTGSTVKKVRTIKTPTPPTFDVGLPRFFSVEVLDSQGHVVTTAHPDFCPFNDYDSQRVSPNSPDNPTYPSSCGSRLTQATVWGVDQGWANPPYFQLSASPTDMPDGKYTMTVAITPSYANQLGVPKSNRTTTVKLDVVTDNGCGKICPAERRARARMHGPTRQVRMAQAQAPGGRYHPVSNRSHGLPDLIALPAHGLSTSHKNKADKDFLNFGATIWNAGPGTFDVEGFRRNGKPTMDARQYVYKGSHSVRSIKIGTFEFDNRVGHHHWHLEDVAQYDLLDAHQDRAVRSGKQSFCLAPTDPIDLTRPGALWSPDYVGLGSSCPSDQSLWLRETLPVGWGDTYVQQKGGQAFNITDLPNGRYYIRVTTNPHGKIHEVTKKNNSALLAVDLGGTPGDRTVSRIGIVHPK
jgi:hypothetical protein